MNNFLEGKKAEKPITSVYIHCSSEYLYAVHLKEDFVNELCIYYRDLFVLPFMYRGF